MTRNVKRRVWCTTSFVGFHRWPAAPESVVYLRNLHRHVFEVRVEVEVDHGDRAVEFIQLKQSVDQVIAHHLGQEDATVRWSCEHWGEALLTAIPGAVSVTVSEDGENGATVTWAD